MVDVYSKFCSMYVVNFFFNNLSILHTFFSSNILVSFPILHFLLPPYLSPTLFYSCLLHPITLVPLPFFLLSLLQSFSFPSPSTFQTNHCSNLYFPKLPTTKRSPQVPTFCNIEIVMMGHWLTSLLYNTELQEQISHFIQWSIWSKKLISRKIWWKSGQQVHLQSRAFSDRKSTIIWRWIKIFQEWHFCHCIISPCLAIKSLPQDRQTGKSQHQTSSPYNYWTTDDP